MSGGSYNYAYMYELPDDIERMADRLDELAPGSAAAFDTRALLAAFSNERLREVWRSVEWFDSGDYGEDQAQESIGEYEK